MKKVEAPNLDFVLRVFEVDKKGLVGHSPDARLRWLLRFAQEMSDKAAQLSGSELECKNAELFAFFAVPTRAGSPHFGRPFAPLSARAINQLAREVSKQLGVLTGGVGPFTIKLKNVQRSVFARSDGSHFAAYDAADPRAAFLMETADVLAQTRLRRCQYAECNRLFVPKKRQSYCSNAHSNLERARRFRQNTPREQQNEARHWLYVRQIAEKHGISTTEAELKIQRRPRATRQSR